MLKAVSAAAMLLMSFAPALAVTSPLEDKDQVAAPGAIQAEEQAKMAQSPEQKADDDIQIIIMGKGMQVQVPNPYKNPSPRMLTDAWAMRA